MKLSGIFIFRPTDEKLINWGVFALAIRLDAYDRYHWSRHGVRRRGGDHGSGGGRKATRAGYDG